MRFMLVLLLVNIVIGGKGFSRARARSLSLSLCLNAHWPTNRLCHAVTATKNPFRNSPKTKNVTLHFPFSTCVLWTQTQNATTTKKMFQKFYQIIHEQTTKNTSKNKIKSKTEEWNRTFMRSGRKHVRFFVVFFCFDFYKIKVVKYMILLA